MRLRPTVVCVPSGPGCGATTFACCLAAELFHKKAPVVLIDTHERGGAASWHGAGGQGAGIPLLIWRFGPDDAAPASARNHRPSGGQPFSLVDLNSAAIPLMGAIAARVVVPCLQTVEINELHRIRELVRDAAERRLLSSLRADPSRLTQEAVSASGERLEKLRHASEWLSSLRARVRGSVDITVVLNRIVDPAAAMLARTRLASDGFNVASTILCEDMAIQEGMRTGEAPCWMGQAGARGAAQFALLAKELALKP